jgi:Fe2+ transport system protein FeoA
MEAELSDQRIDTHGHILPLNEVREGWKVEVVAYRSRGRRSQRLVELGLTPGTSVRILRRAQSQPLLVCVRGTHLAIDQDTAESLTVRVLHTSNRGKRRWRGWRKRMSRRRNGNGCDLE